MQSEKLTHFYIRTIKICVFIIPFLPVYVDWSFIFPFIAGKNYAFRILVEVAAVFWIGLIVLNKEYRLKNSPLLTSLLLFTLIVGIADLFGVNPSKSFWSTYERMEGYITMLHLLLYFIIIKSIFRTQKDWTIFLTLVVIGGVFVSSYSLYHKLVKAPDFRARGTIGAPPFLASYMILTAFAGLTLFWRSRTRILRYFCLTAVLFNLVIIYVTATRGAIIALFTGLIFYSLFYITGKTRDNKDKLFRKAAMATIAGCIIIPAVFLIFYKPPEAPPDFRGKDFVEFHNTLPRLATIAQDRAVSFRLEAWTDAWKGFQKRPVLGWGQENFVSTYMYNPLPFGRRIHMQRPHNIMFEWLVNAGILGLISYLLIYGAAFYVIWNSFSNNSITKAEATMLSTGLFVYFTQNLFIFDTISSYLVFFSVLAYIDGIDDSKGKVINRDIVIPKGKSVCITLISLFVFFAAAYFLHYKPMAASHQATQITHSFRNKKYKSFLSVLDDYKKALSYNTFGNSEIIQMMEGVSQTILKNNLFAAEGAATFVQETTAELEKLLIADSLNIHNWIRIINHFHELAVYEPSYIESAKVLIKEFMRFSPENQWGFFALADNYILKKDYINALETIKKAVALDPQNDSIQIKLATLGIMASREDVLNQALADLTKVRMSKVNHIDKGNGAVFSLDELLIFARTSRQAGNNRLALKFYKDIISLSPEEAGYHFEIAEVYLRLGDTITARQEAEKAAELDPVNFSVAAKELIE